MFGRNVKPPRSRNAPALLRRRTDPTGAPRAPSVPVSQHSPHNFSACPMPSAPTLGIDLGGTKVESALVDASGRVLHSHRHPTDAERGPDRVVADIVACVEACLEAATARASAAGIGVAGQVDTEAGVVQTATAGRPPAS